MADFDGGLSLQTVPLNAPADHSAPLKGIVICCTSVPDEKRTQIAEWAKQMGALHRYDLTLDVTHLIIGDYKTDKYRYVARERNDVQPMTIEWIEAVRERWINDQEIDLETLERKYIRPTFYGFKISMTGCDDPEERLEVADLVKANGAVYEGDLTRQITHLISFKTEGAKYKAAKAWKLNIVSVEWLHHSVERGMILDEKLYDPALPVEERGKGAWDRMKPKRTSLGKRSREGSTISLEGGKRKIRRTASTKLNSQHDSLWGEIVAGGSVTQVNRSGVWEREEIKTPAQEIPAQSKEPEAAARPTQTTENSTGKGGIFSGCRFVLHGFTPAKTEILHTHLASNDADISTGPDILPLLDKPSIRQFRIVPHNFPVESLPELPSNSNPMETITEWWVERCLHHKKFMDPSEHIIGRPFPVFPIEDFVHPERIIVSSSAFSGIDLLHLTRAVELIGGIYSEDFTPKSSVLITKSVTAVRKDKFDHAQEWHIPIVTSDWLWDSISAGVKQSMSKYRCRGQKRTDSLPPGKLKPIPIPERSKSDISTSASDATRSSTRPSHPSDMENTFVKSPPPISNLEPGPGSNHAPDTSSSLTDGPSLKSEPLSERSQNLSSPSRTVSTAPAPSDHPFSRPQEERTEEISNALSDLLAKTKTAQPEPTKRRGIIGRVVSNASVTSRATSVDSTATHGYPVQYPENYSTTIDKTANERIEQLMNGDRRTNDDESQPSSTQLEYEDPESTIAKETMMARMRGEKIDVAQLRKGKEKERSVTVGDFAAKQKVTRRGRSRPSAGVGGR